MQHEVSLVITMILLLLVDLVLGKKSSTMFQPVALAIFALHTIYGFCIGNEPIGHADAFGGMYETGNMQMCLKNILNLGTLLVFLFGYEWNKKNFDTVGEFYVLMLSTLFGMYLMISAGDFLLFYIGLETASIPMATLVALDKNKKSAEAAAKYVLTAAFSSGVMLFGISLVYGTCGGALYFDEVYDNFNFEPLQIMAMIFFMAGLCFKVSLVPFHLWTADTYEGAPTPVSAHLSVMSKGAAVFAFFCILWKAFGAERMMDADMEFTTAWHDIIWWIIVITITVGNLFALRQKNMKRFLAFSSVSQAGYIMLGVIAGTPASMGSMVYYILVYMFTNLVAFGVIGVIEDKAGKLNMDDYNDLYKTNPKIAVVMMLAMFSLGGIPPFAGFFSKFFIFAGAAEQGEYLLVFLALANTIISLFYYLMVVKAMFINHSDNPIPTFKTGSLALVGITVCVVAMLALGLISPVYEYLINISFGI